MPLENMPQTNMDYEQNPLLYVMEQTEEADFSPLNGMKNESNDPWIHTCDVLPQNQFRPAVDEAESHDITILVMPDLDKSVEPLQTSFIQQNEQGEANGLFPQIHSPEMPLTPPPSSSGISPNEDSETQSPEPPVEATVENVESVAQESDLSRALRSHSRGGAGRSRTRTPRTLTKLMQQHRENERHRHRGLNASINEIYGRIPGCQKGKAVTKIVKLRNVINFICHYEDKIQSLCEEIGVDVDFKHLFLSPNIQRTAEAKKNPFGGSFQHSSGSSSHSTSSGVAAYERKESLSPDRFIRDLHSRKRRRVSSPIMESTTDTSCRKPRRLQRARNLKDACSKTVTSRPNTRKGESKTATISKVTDQEVEDDALVEVCNVLREAGTLTPEVEKSMEWLGTIPADPENIAQSDMTEKDEEDILPITEEFPNEDIFQLYQQELEHPDINVYDEEAREEYHDNETCTSTTSGVTTFTSSSSGVTTFDSGVWCEENSGQNNQDTQQVIKIEPYKKQKKQEVYLIDQNGVATRCTDSEIHQISNISVTEMPPPQVIPVPASVPASTPAPPRHEACRGFTNYRINGEGSPDEEHAFWNTNSRNHSKSIMIEYVGDRLDFPNSENLPFARYSVRHETEPSSSYKALSYDKNARHCKFQGMKCLEDNRRALQRKRSEELIKANPQVMDLSDGVAEDGLTVIKTPRRPVGKPSQKRKIKIERIDSPGSIVKQPSRPKGGKIIKKPVDLRKTSWMNGFMMYSRLHRREYIEKTPGVHTSFITKLMGQDWRKLTEEGRLPYRLQAEEYIKNVLVPAKLPSN